MFIYIFLTLLIVMIFIFSDKWEDYCPKTNCLWLEYLADKLIFGYPGINVPANIKKPRKEELIGLLRRVRTFSSASEYVSSPEFNEIAEGYLH